ncbi:membrane protein [Mycolicibacterium cyprinidarum]|uniref:Membrane protein n=1 Tax=Mycolicibacterium cyprinidarum TaxID=2860311 RepID=A0ABQ4VBW7_9MYCO|nr:membrane protein [Mycolicibacterium sp. NGTWS1803]GJF13718.1 membrane protein [Mycolicibacterium sp. NGTWS0302]GJF18400.1 membrane protein [Mycolicibacterium sp. NGTWSNA01]
MLFSAPIVRRAVAGGLGGGALAGAVALGVLGAAPMASAQPQPPNCTAADFSGVAAGVSAASSTYLFTHPEVNNFFTGLHGASPDQIETDVDAYLVANPQIFAELTEIRRPLVDMRDRCGIIIAPDDH